MTKLLEQTILEEEGFAHVFEHVDEPDTIYPPHAHKGKANLGKTRRKN